jgi:drug/metabolite transporter (DMT)-like permease
MEFLLLASEVILSAYPLLIKLTDASIPFQVGLRMITFTSLAYFVARITNTPFHISDFLSKETLATGFLNLVHVGTSYTAFDELTAGNAMALFYTYPIMNILGASLAFGESIELSKVPWIGLAMGGAIALSQPTTKNWTLLGVVSALMAAATETGIYLWFRSKGDDPEANVSNETFTNPFGFEKIKSQLKEHGPWTKMAQMYGGSFVLWAAIIIFGLFFGFYNMNIFKISGKGLSGVLLFNSFIGFLGYALRFYIIPKVSTVAFSALSFFGVVSAYGLGWLFMGETATGIQMAGAAAIIAANAVLLRKEIV